MGLKSQRVARFYLLGKSWTRQISHYFIFWLLTSSLHPKTFILTKIWILRIGKLNFYKVRVLKGFYQSQTFYNILIFSVFWFESQNIKQKIDFKLHHSLNSPELPTFFSFKICHFVTKIIWELKHLLEKIFCRHSKTQVFRIPFSLPQI